MKSWPEDADAPALLPPAAFPDDRAKALLQEHAAASNNTVTQSAPTKQHHDRPQPGESSGTSRQFLETSNLFRYLTDDDVSEAWKLRWRDDRAAERAEKLQNERAHRSDD